MDSRRHKIDLEGADGKSPPLEVDQGVDMVAIHLTMSRANWCELWNAVNTKRSQIENGDYGEGDDPQDNPLWIANLLEIEEILTKALTDKGVTF